MSRALSRGTLRAAKRRLMDARDQQFSVYILRCSDGSYYVGSTTNVTARLAVHNAGSGPHFTAARRPVVLAYQESFDTAEQARQREIQLKKWSRAKKSPLIDGNLDELRALSRSRAR